MIVVAICTFIILTSLLLEFIMGLIRRHWVTKEGQARQLARDLDSQFWLLRMGLQGTGVRHWRRGGKKMDSYIPVVDQDCEVLPPSTDYDIDDFYKPSSAALTGPNSESVSGSVEKN
jgi:hypothetical protein